MRPHAASFVRRRLLISAVWKVFLTSSRLIYGADEWSCSVRSPNWSNRILRLNTGPLDRAFIDVRSRSRREAIPTGFPLLTPSGSAPQTGRLPSGPPLSIDSCFSMPSLPKCFRIAVCPAAAVRCRAESNARWGTIRSVTLFRRPNTHYVALRSSFLPYLGEQY
jgi:hypothetical protein